MNKMIPLIARTALKEEVKKEAKVNATKDRLAKSIAFSAYNLRWHAFSSITLKNIAFNSWFVKRSNFNTIWLSWLNRILAYVIARRAKPDAAISQARGQWFGFQQPKPKTGLLLHLRRIAMTMWAGLRFNPIRCLLSNGVNKPNLKLVLGGY